MDIDSINIDALSVDTQYALMRYAEVLPAEEREHEESFTVEQFTDMEGQTVFENGEPLMCEVQRIKVTPIGSRFNAALALLEKAPEEVIRDLVQKADSGLTADAAQAQMPDDITNEQARPIFQAAYHESLKARYELYRLGLRIKDRARAK